MSNNLDELNIEKNEPRNLKIIEKNHFNNIRKENKFRTSNNKNNITSANQKNTNYKKYSNYVPKNNLQNFPKLKSINNKQEDELLVKAFDPDDNIPIPDNYMLDELNDDSINFLRKSKAEEIIITASKLSKSVIEKQNITNYDYNSNSNGNIFSNISVINKIDTKYVDNTQEGVPQASITKIIDKQEFMFSINVNNEKLIEQSYRDFNIQQDWKNIILYEFKYLSGYYAELKATYKNCAFDNILEQEQQININNYSHILNLNNLGKDFLIHEDVIKEFKLYREHIKSILYPSSDNLSTFLALKLNNKNLIKLIKHFEKNLILINNENVNMYNALIWVYMLLSFLQLPLVDDDNSVLYLLNKNIKNFISKKFEEEKTFESNVNSSIDNASIYPDYLKNDLISAKIIYVILSEFFNQKVL